MVVERSRVRGSLGVVFLLFIPVVSAGAIAGCGSKKSEDAESSVRTTETKAEAKPDAAAPPSDKILNADGEEWQPAEHKTGRKRWKDSVVYLDGVPIGALWFGEMPRKLRPVWKEQIESLDFRPGDKGPQERIIYQRRFRLVDYLEAIGVDLKKVKEMHIYGGKIYAARVTGKEALRVRDTLQFGFGTETEGKALFYPPFDMDTNTNFDHIASISIYQDKEPAIVDDRDVVMFEGKVVDGVPYYGPPLRGGIRIYIDDRMRAVIKRNKLTDMDELADWSEDGTELQWRLKPFLKAQGVDISNVKIGYVIYEEQVAGKMTGAELQDQYFVAAPRGKGRVLMGKEKQTVQALMLYTDNVPPRVIEERPPPKAVVQDDSVKPPQP